MDLTDFIPMLASHLGIASSQLVFYIICLHLLAKFGSRMIPNSATGWLAVLRRACVVLGVDFSSRLTPDVTIADVAEQTRTTPPVSEKVVAAVESRGSVVEDTQTRAGG